MLGVFFAGQAHCEQQSFHIGVLNAAMDQVKVGLYVTDPRTDAILYMNKFMKDGFKLEHPEGEDLLAGAAVRDERALPVLPCGQAHGRRGAGSGSPLGGTEHADGADL